MTVRRQPGERRPGLNEILDRIEATAAGAERVSIADVMEVVGQRSFGPLLLVPGLTVLSPLSGIPTLPSMSAVIVALISGQMLLGRRYFWLPRVITERSIDGERLERPMRFLRPIARVTDRIVRPRLDVFTSRPASFAIAAACMVVAVTMPPLEVVPFLNSAAGAVITAFGLALVAGDGLLALIAFVLTVGVVGLGLHIIL